MSNPLTPDDPRRPGRPPEHPEERLGDTWPGTSPGAAADRETDRRLRTLIGPVTPLHTPPYSFERVVLRAQRRRHRTAFIAAAAVVSVLAAGAGGVLVGTHLGDGRVLQVADPGCDQSRSGGGKALGGGDTSPAYRALDFAAPVAWTGGAGSEYAGFAVAGTSGGPKASAASGGVDSVVESRAREVMDRKHEWAIGGALTAAALFGGIVAGCSSAGGDTGPSANATESGGPTQSQSPGTVLLPTNAPSAAATQSGGAGSSASAVPRCHTVDLSPAVSIVAGSQATGHEAMNIKLTNTSNRTCTVYGYPGMMLEDTNLSGQATNVVRDHSAAPKTLTVASGASVATTALFDFDVPAPDEPATGDCEAPSVYVQLTPPDETTQLSATITGGPVTVCQHGKISVLPFISGAKGPNQ
ncbi:MAG: DUF4232 domain-containing protein [Actinocrinis sp.]